MAIGNGRATRGRVTQDAPRGTRGTQEAPRRHQGTQEAPSRHQAAPGDTRNHLGGTQVSQEGAQEAPGGTQEGRGGLEAEVVRNNRVDYRKGRDRPFRVDKTSASVIIGAFVQQLSVARIVRVVLLPTPRVCT